MKSRIPPVVIQKRIGGSSGIVSKRKPSNAPSDDLRSSAPPPPNKADHASTATAVAEHNGNGDSMEGTETNSRNSLEKIIPRLMDSPSNLGDVDPHLWESSDVSEFLRINDCGAYCDSFERNVSQIPEFFFTLNIHILFPLFLANRWNEIA